MIAEIPRITDHHLNPGDPGWTQPVTPDGRKCKPIVRCNCGFFCGLGLHHVHADGTVTASFYHTPQCDPGRGCGWHVHLKLKDYDGGEFKPNES
jgi:hypothetical protein